MNEEDTTKVRQIRIFYKGHLKDVYTDDQILSLFNKNNRLVMLTVEAIDEELTFS